MHEKHEYAPGEKFLFRGLPNIPVDEPVPLIACHVTRPWCEACWFYDIKADTCRDNDGLFPCNGHHRKDLQFIYFGLDDGTNPRKDG